MKKLTVQLCNYGLIWSAVFAIIGLQISCTREDDLMRKTVVTLNIPLPGDGNLKSAASVTSVTRVTITVTADGETLVPETDLDITGNRATGKISVDKGTGRTFTVKATDGNNIVQWQGATTENIDKNDFTVNLTLSPILPAAADLQATRSENIVNLSWNQNADDDFAGYDLYRSDSENSLGDNIYSSNVNTTTQYNDSTLAEGKTYYYTLVVTDTEGFNINSNLVQIELPYVLPTPSILRVDSVSNIVELSWTPNPDPDFNNYVLYRSDNETTFDEQVYSTNTLSDTTFTDTLVTAGNTYYYRVVVTDADELSSGSNVVQAEIPQRIPTAVHLDASLDGYVYAYWTQNADPDFDRYELYRSQMENALGSKIYSTNVVTEREFVDTTFIEGNTYFYTVVVYNISGSGSESNVAQVDVPAVPPVPSYLKGYDYEEIYLYWTENPDSDFARYELYRSKDNSPGDRIFTTTDVTETFYYDNSLPEPGIYNYKVIVFDEHGFSSESNLFQVRYNLITPGTLDGWSEGVYVELNWTQNYDYNFAKYELYRSESEADLGTMILSTDTVTQTNYADYPVPEGKTYYYRILVYSTDGYYAESNTIKIVIPNYDPTPSKLSVVSVSSVVELSWTRNYDADFAKYELYRSNSQNSLGTLIFTTSNVTETAYNDGKVAENSTYYYTVIVYDISELFSKSNVVQVKTPIF